MAIGDPWELEVADALWLRGYTVQRVGTGQLNAVMRQLLREYRTQDGRKTGLRWGPDICAAKRTTRVRAFLIDAKAGDTWQRTDRHDVEIDALEGAANAEMIWGIPAAFVFQDWSVASPETIRKHTIRQMNGVGPGRTDFVIFPRSACKPFDTVFGALAEGERAGAA